MSRRSKISGSRYLVEAFCIRHFCAGSAEDDGCQLAAPDTECWMRENVVVVTGDRALKIWGPIEDETTA